MDNLEKNAWEGLAPLFCYSKVYYRGSEVRHFSEVLKEKEQRQYSDKRKKKKKRNSKWIEGKNSASQDCLSTGIGCPERIGNLHPWRFSKYAWINS